MRKGRIVSFLLGIVVVSSGFFAGADYILSQTVTPKQPQPLSKPEKKDIVVVSKIDYPVGHPLVPVIQWAERERPKIAQLVDYSAIVTKQECVNGTVQEAQVMEVKIRHKPFSVYVKFLYPKSMVGQEAIYWEGKNDNKIVAHGVGVQKTFGTLRLEPKGMIAMRGNKYPVTEIGILNLTDKLLEVGRKDSKFGECEVNYSEGVKIDGRNCTMIQVTHPTPRSNFIFNIARIFIDKELDMPIRYESYDWPKKEGSKVTLIEAYTYQQLKLNVGFTDLDFDHKNPSYGYTGE